MLPQLTPPADSTELLWSQDESLARMFAASSKFQAEVGTNDVAETLNNHVIDWAAVDPEDTEFEKARVLIEYASANRKLSGTWTSSGGLAVCIERKQPFHQDNSAGYRASKNNFMRFVSSVLTEIEIRSKEASETILGFNPRRFNSYDLLGGPQCVPTSEVFHTPEQIENEQLFNIWYIQLSFTI